MEPTRPTTVPNQNKKKYSVPETDPHKQSFQEFLEQKTVHYEKEDQNCFPEAKTTKADTGKRNTKLTSRKRGKSKSLENLKVKYYARTPEPLSRSNSKGVSKSKSKTKSKLKSKSKSKSKHKKSFNDESPR